VCRAEDADRDDGLREGQAAVGVAALGAATPGWVLPEPVVGQDDQRYRVGERGQGWQHPAFETGDGVVEEGVRVDV